MNNNASNSNDCYLLVDDDDVFNQVLGRSFNRRGLKTLLANTADEATAIAKQHEITHAVLDLKLEHSSGLNLLQELLRIRPRLRVVMLTGYSSISTAVEAIKLGAINYLCKPADSDQVLAAFNSSNHDVSAETEIAERPPSINRLEWEHIQRVLNENDNNISATARALGMHRRTLQRKLQKRPAKD